MLYVLETACANDTKLVCVHDRPEGSALGTYRSVIELAREGGFADDEIKRLESTGKLKHLGSFTRVEG